MVAGVGGDLVDRVLHPAGRRSGPGLPLPLEARAGARCYCSRRSVIAGWYCFQPRHLASDRRAGRRLLSSPRPLSLRSSPSSNVPSAITCRRSFPNMSRPMWWKHSGRSAISFWMAAGMKPQRVTATVLFTDLKGFSTTSEKMDPATLMNWMNEYMNGVARHVDPHDGIINKYIGDAIMALFGVPIAHTIEAEIDRDARNAVECALAMRAEIEEAQCGLDRAGPAEHRDARGHPHRAAGRRQHGQRAAPRIHRARGHRQYRRSAGRRGQGCGAGPAHDRLHDPDRRIDLDRLHGESRPSGSVR